MNVVFAIATGIMFAFGVFLLLRRDLIKSAMGFYVLFTAINFLLLAVGAFNGDVAPYVDDQNQIAGQPSDPMVQALILTAIVISFGSYSLLTAFIAVASRRFRSVDTDDIDKLKG